MRSACGVLLGILAGCGVVQEFPIEAADVPEPPFPDCVAEEYAYFGETTLAALGVSRPSGRPPPNANRVGLVWITADRRLNRGEPEGADFGRMLCVEFADGSAMTDFPVVDAWEPPGSSQRNMTMPWQLLPVALGVALLIATSIVVFRRSR